MRLLERYVRTRDALSQINGASAGEENTDWRPSSLFWQICCLLGSATTPLQYCGNIAVLAVNVYRCFGRTYRSHYYGSRNRPMKMGLLGYRETSVRNYHYSLRNNPEERSSQENTFTVSLANFEIISRLSTMSSHNPRENCWSDFDQIVYCII